MTLLPTIGINLAGAEFDYVFWPARNYLAHIRAKGVQALRFPIRWEKLQPEYNGPLDPGYLTGLRNTLIECANVGIKVMPEIHNYAWVKGSRMESTPASATRHHLADLLVKLDAALAPLAEAARPYGYGIMNEPNNMPQERVTWKAIAQHVVAEFRKANMSAFLYVCGDGWSGAHSWGNVNKDFLLEDPADKLVYEAHQYFDHNSAGHYNRATAAEEGATLDTAWNRLRPFIEWGQKHNVRLAIGEIGIPYNKDFASWKVIMDRALDICIEHDVQVFGWSGGDHLGSNNVCTFQTEVFGPNNPWVAISFNDTPTFTECMMPRLAAYSDARRVKGAAVSAPVTPPPVVTPPVSPPPVIEPVPITPAPPPSPAPPQATTPQAKAQTFVGLVAGTNRAKIEGAHWNGGPVVRRRYELRVGNEVINSAESEEDLLELTVPTAHFGKLVKARVHAFTVDGKTGWTDSWNSIIVTVPAPVTPPAPPAPPAPTGPTQAEHDALKAEMETLKAQLAASRADDAADDAQIAALEDRLSRIRQALL